MSNRVEKGMALIELILFIVIIGIVSTGLMAGLFQTLLRSDDPNKIVKAAYLANARMQVILLQRAVNGVSGLSDPCVTDTLAACAFINSYATSNSLTFNATTFTVVGNSTTIKVVVTGSGLAQSTVETVVSNYE
jgi:type II secretory pathway pseudopilin PulG